MVQKVPCTMRVRVWGPKFRLLGVWGLGVPKPYARFLVFSKRHTAEPRKGLSVFRDCASWCRVWGEAAPAMDDGRGGTPGPAAWKKLPMLGQENVAGCGGFWALMAPILHLLKTCLKGLRGLIKCSYKLEGRSFLNLQVYLPKPCGAFHSHEDAPEMGGSL